MEKQQASVPPAPSGRRQQDRSGTAASRVESNAGPAIVAALGALYILWSLVAPEGASKRWTSDLLQAAAPIGGLVWAYWGARGAPRGGAPWSVAAITLAVAAWGLGQISWCHAELVLNVRPFPAWADAGFLTASVSMVVGILLLPGGRMPAALRFRALLDSLLAMSAVIAFGWFFVLGPTILEAHGEPLEKALGAAYPMLDLMVIFCAMIVSSRPSEPGLARVRNLLCAAALAYVVSDGAFALGNLGGTYGSGGPLDVGWMVATLLMGGAVRALRGLNAPAAYVAEAPERALSPQRILLPYALVPIVAGLAAYAWHARIEPGLAKGVYVAAGLLVVLLLVRQVFSLIDTSRLYRDLRQAYENLEALATCDGMTGLANHRTFQQRLREEIARSQNEDAPLALLLVDVDHFKSYNDQFGHPAGDDALKIVARLLQESLRTSDLAARYGGEEFAAVLPDTGSKGAGAVAERIRRACETANFPHRSVTLSIGVALLNGSEASELIEAADRALYDAKRGGRNRVVVTPAGFLTVVVADETVDLDAAA